MSALPEMTEANPYAASIAALPEPAQAYAELADRWVRLGAALLDALCYAGLSIASAILLPILAFGGETLMALGTVLLLLATVGLLVVNCVLLHRHGQTIGKRMLGIRIVRRDGRPVGLLRVFGLRWLPITLLSLIPYVGIVIGLVNVLMIFGDDRRCLHDLIADTTVVKV